MPLAVNPSPENRVILAHRERLEPQDLRDRPGQPGRKAQQALKDLLGRKGQLANAVKLDLPAPQVPSALRALRERPVLRGQRAPPENAVSLAHKAWPGPRALQGLRDRSARPRESG